MRIKKIKSEGLYIYPATIAAAVKDANFLKEGNIPMTLGEINLYIEDHIPTKVSQLTNDLKYQKVADADKKYVPLSGTTSGSGSGAQLSISFNGTFNNYSKSGLAFNAVRDLTGTMKYQDDAGSGYVLNAASFGVKDNGTAAFSHKKYDSFNATTGAAANARNTAVLIFSGKSGLLYAKNTGGDADVTDAMYKRVGVIDSPDDELRVYSAAQVDALISTLKTTINKLQLDINVFSFTKIIVSESELSAELYVDLGLPSGLKWSSCNIGAEHPWEAGKYFQWGDSKGYYIDDGAKEHSFINITPYLTVDTVNLSEAKFTKYVGSLDSQYCDPNANPLDLLKTELDLEDDGVYMNTNGEAQMPTTQQILELLQNTTLDLAACSYTLLGQTEYKLGWKITSKINDNCIFIPLVGFTWNGKLDNDTITSIWSKSLSRDPMYGNRIYLGTDAIQHKSTERFRGYPLRGVKF